MKHKKKGFTLVELIVVLAILAILAAMLVPALTGYIDKANEKKINSALRQFVIAVQSEVSEQYAYNQFTTDGKCQAFVQPDGTARFDGVDSNGVDIGKICQLSELATDIVVTVETDTKTDSNGHVTVSEKKVYTGKLKDGITYLNFQYDTSGKVVSAEIYTKDKSCKYYGLTGEFNCD